MEWSIFFEKGIWLGCAAIGFAILFNVPVRTLVLIFFLGALGGLTKALLVNLNASVVLASLAGASVIGILGVYAAYRKHTPPMVFSIPAVIPMIPGVFAYKTMLGMIHLAGNTVTENYGTVMAETVNNGLKAFFILLALAAGVSIPLFITRKESIKEIVIERQLKKGAK
jgi:uncharacterized membrane protein YjjB (DUF3815 family)